MSKPRRKPIWPPDPELHYDSRIDVGKLTRAEPIAALYEQHRVHHVGTFGVLEDQMCDYVPMASKSPDRMDALVWALTELSGDREQEVIYEYSDIRSISPELDDFPDFRTF